MAKHHASHTRTGHHHEGKSCHESEHCGTGHKAHARMHAAPKHYEAHHHDYKQPARPHEPKHDK